MWDLFRKLVSQFLTVTQELAACNRYLWASRNELNKPHFTVTIYPMGGRSVEESLRVSGGLLEPCTGQFWLSDAEVVETFSCVSRKCIRLLDVRGKVLRGFNHTCEHVSSRPCHGQVRYQGHRLPSRMDSPTAQSLPSCAQKAGTGHSRVQNLWAAFLQCRALTIKRSTYVNSLGASLCHTCEHCVGAKPPTCELSTTPPCATMLRCSALTCCACWMHRHRTATCGSRFSQEFDREPEAAWGSHLQEKHFRRWRCHFFPIHSWKHR